MKIINQPTSLMTALALAVMLSGCAMAPDPFSQIEFAAKAQLRQDAISKETEPVRAPISLAEAMARAFK
ncbi:MAG: TolC family protein, partial [Magnetococcales bacterium]|nr:TolC family protein [Magnetococcales bacterium]